MALRVSLSPSPSSKASNNKVVLLRLPAGLPAGLPLAPLDQRPRAARFDGSSFAISYKATRQLKSLRAVRLAKRRGWVVKLLILKD